MDVQGLMVRAKELIAVFGLKLVAAVAVFVIGRWAANAITHIIKKIMKKANVDETLTSFISSLSYIALMTVVVIAALGQLGVQTTSFIAILGAAGLAVGLALQNSLSNFASGVMMMFFRPIKVGDVVEGGGVTGAVKEVQIFTTVLITPDNKTIIVPNSKITADKIINYSSLGSLRQEFTFTINYSDDIDKTRKIVAEILDRNPKVLKSPAPDIGVADIVGNANIKMLVRPWVKPEHYPCINGELIEEIKKSLDANKINLPADSAATKVILVKEE